MKGIDVSSYQGKIDWAKVKQAGYQFAIIRLGIGDDIVSQDDSELQNNIRGCQENNIPYAFYLVSYAIRSEGVESVQSEIEHTSRLIQGTSPFAIFYDMEIVDTVFLGEETLTSFASKYCDYFKNLGYTVGVYANRYWFLNNLDYALLKSRGYKIWLAHYGVDQPSLECDIWQYTNQGKVEGITTNTTDLNIMYDDMIDERDEIPNPTKSITELAEEVIAGSWGNGDDRKNKLIRAGYNYDEVQAKVNELLGNSNSITSYTVQSGDTLSGIALKFGITYQTLATFNHISDPNKIFVGQVLKIPSSDSNSSSFEYYVVQSGDNLSTIAKKYGTTVSQLQSWNHIKNANLIYIGQRLRVK